MPRRKRAKKTKENPTLETTLDPTEIIQPKDEDIGKYDIQLISAKDYEAERKTRITHLITNTPLDMLMRISGEGFETGAVYHAYGANGVGKTQLCNTMAVLNEDDVIWIDGGEDTFRPERLREIAIARGKDPDEVLERIHVIHALNATHLEAIVAKLPKLLMRIKWKEVKDGNKTILVPEKKEFIQSRLKTGKVGLIILDSLAPTFTLQYQTLDRLSPRQKAIQRTIQYLRIMSVWFNCVVIVTNQVRMDINAFQFAPIWDKQKPVGGMIVRHNIDFQIMIRKGKQNLRIARVVDSSNTELGEIEFYITTAGIVGVEDEEEEEKEQT